MHFSNECWFKSHKCTDCGKIGHKEGFCSRPQLSNNNKNRRYGKVKHNKQEQSNNLKTKSIFLVSKINNESHRKYIDLKINDIQI